MTRRHIWISLLVGALMTAAATAQTESLKKLTPRQRAEYNQLVHKRNELYAKLTLLNEQARARSGPGYRLQQIQGGTKRTQEQLDLVELRLADLATRHNLTVAPPPEYEPDSARTSVAMASQSSRRRLTPEQRMEYSKLVHRRNRLHAELTRLDKQASDLIKKGENPLVIHAEQVSVQDQLDLAELQLAILATRHGVAVPPLPGRDPAPDSGTVVPEDEWDQDLQRAFARGRERALVSLRRETDRFLASLDFRAFLND